VTRHWKRSSLASQMVLIAAFGAGLAAFRDGSDLSLKVVFSVMLGMLLVGLLGAIVTWKDPAWVGFTLFGWGYALSACFSPIRTEIQQDLLTQPLLEDVVVRMYRLPPRPPSFPFRVDTNQAAQPVRLIDGEWVPLTPEEATMLNEHHFLSRVYANNVQHQNSVRIGHSLLAMIFAWFGARLGRFLATRNRSDDARSSSLGTT
jgi:hypothetical protein